MVTGLWDASLIRRLLWVGAALTIVVAYGTLGYVLLEGWSFLDALYMTVTTMTTVGFREVRELDTGGRLFTLTVVLLGGGTALIGVSLMAAAIAEADLNGRTRRRRMARRIEELGDHFIVCAYGRVGRAAVRELRAAGVPFVVLDPREDLRDRMEREGIAFMIDDPSLEPVLRQARIETARGLICAVDSDATNVFITLAARSMKPDLFIVARASEPGSQERLERAGADRIVSPYASSGRHMVRMALDPGVLDPFSDEIARSAAIQVEERRVQGPSELVGRSVAEVGAPVLALRRTDGVIHASPAADTLLEDGDVVLVLIADASTSAG